MIRFAALFVVSVFVAQSASDGVWIDVPFVRQAKKGCGSASVAMIMQYWRPGSASSDAVRIHQATHTAKVEEIPASALQRYLNDHGFQAFAFAAAREDLHAHLAKGRPLIVGLQFDEKATRHYVVLAGITGGFVLLNDPADRKLRKMDRASFDRYWGAAGNWTLLALPVLHP